MKRKLMIAIFCIILVFLTIPLIGAEKTAANIYLIVVGIVGILSGIYIILKK